MTTLCMSKGWLSRGGVGRALVLPTLERRREQRCETRSPTQGCFGWDRDTAVKHSMVLTENNLSPGHFPIYLSRLVRK